MPMFPNNSLKECHRKDLINFKILYKKIAPQLRGYFFILCTPVYAMLMDSSR